MEDGQAGHRLNRWMDGRMDEKKMREKERDCGRESGKPAPPFSFFLHWMGRGVASSFLGFLSFALAPPLSLSFPSLCSCFVWFWDAGKVGGMRRDGCAVVIQVPCSKGGNFEARGAVAAKGRLH